MKLDLTEIVTHLGKQMSYEIDEPPIEDFGGDVWCVAPIAGQVTFTNTGRHIVARGHFSTTVELECSRCLRMHSIVIDLPIEEELPIAGHTLEMLEAAQEEEIPEDEREPLFVDSIFDLTELLRQSILLALPMRPLCSEECKGLCPHCGANLNEGPCGCPTDLDANPFAALAKLFEDEESVE
jgi:uncharacterized protein